MKTLLPRSLLVCVCVVLSFSVSGCETTAVSASAPLPLTLDGGDVYEVGAVDQPPLVASKTRLQYPVQMRRNLQQGRAEVEFIVDVNGKVRNARVVTASHPDFAVAAVEWVNGWKYSPGLKKGWPVATKMVEPVNFKIVVHS